MTHALNALSSKGLRRDARVCTPLPVGRCLIDGQNCVNFATNDYLGLGFHPRVIAAALDATSRYGSGARASALVCGRCPLHDELEQALARFEGTEAAVLFPSGFATNVGTIGALVTTGDVVFCDRFNHASLIDGCRLSGAKFRVYAHQYQSSQSQSSSTESPTLGLPENPLETLALEIEKHRSARRRLIVSDSVFSMDGDSASLPELFDLAERSQSMLLIDEAHAMGVYGKHGRGLCEEAGVEGHEYVRVGTMSKTLGSQGGFVAGSQALCDWLRNTARTQMFSTALTPGACGAALESLRLIGAMPERRQHVRSLAFSLRSGLKEAGWRVLGDDDCPIVPLVVGDPREAVELSASFLREGILVPAIRPPTVPQNTSRLRFSLSADHSWADVEHCLQVVNRHTLRR